MTTREMIARLANRGLGQSEIARRLGLAPPTVAYHLSRLSSARPVQDKAAGRSDSAPAVDAAVRQIRTREEVARLLEQGMSKLEIARTLGLSRSTVSYHARRLGAPVDERAARRYDWQAIQAFYDQGHSLRECQARYGFSRHSWYAAVRRGAIVPRPRTSLSIEVLCQEATPRSRDNLKRRLLAAGIKESRCELCGINAWRGRPLSMSLHHINGDRHDNRLENLQLLCANCHSQTGNFGGRAPRNTLRRAA